METGVTDMGTATAERKIVEDTTGKFYLVWETGVDGLAHVWNGKRVKRVRGGWDDAGPGTRNGGSSPVELVRKTATRFVEVFK